MIKNGRQELPESFHVTGVISGAFVQDGVKRGRNKGVSVCVFPMYTRSAFAPKA